MRRERRVERLEQSSGGRGRIRVLLPGHSKPAEVEPFDSVLEVRFISAREER